jgi:transposase
MSTEQKPKREIPEIYSHGIKETTVLQKRNAPGVSLEKVRPYFAIYLDHQITVTEIAEKTEMSINAVKSTIARARKAGILPPVTEESIKIAKSRAHLGRGRLQKMLLPDLLQGMSTKEVMEKYNLSYSQVKGVLRGARDKGILPRPTREETRQKMRTSHLGKPSPRKDKRTSADALIAKLSSTKGEDLSESEKAYFRALVKAREIVDALNLPRLENLYKEYGRELKKGKQGRKLNLLEMFYASMVANGKTDTEHKPLYISMLDVLMLYIDKYNQHIDLNTLVDDVHFLLGAMENLFPNSTSLIVSEVDQLFSLESAEALQRKMLEKKVLAESFLPLFLRGGTADEVAKITGYDSDQVREALNYLHKKGLFSLKEDLIETTYQTVQTDTETEEYNCLIMARNLISQGLLSNSLSSWEELHKLYRSYQRSLPSFVKRIILEVFLIARKQAVKMDKSLLESYIITGETVDRKWFETSSLNEEQFFITRHLSLITENLQRLSPKKEKKVVFSTFLQEDDVYISGRRIA